MGKSYKSECDNLRQQIVNLKFEMSQQVEIKLLEQKTKYQELMNKTLMNICEMALGKDDSVNGRHKKKNLTSNILESRSTTKRQILANFLINHHGGKWKGTRTELRKALKKSTNLDINEMTLWRYLRDLNITKASLKINGPSKNRRRAKNG